jgi:sialate O-acetylesterase
MPWPQDKLIGFTLAGEDRTWHDAEAKIEGDSVIVSSPAVTKPVAVRYAWANSPRCNLYSREGLPTVPFRSDDWPMPKK